MDRSHPGHEDLCAYVDGTLENLEDAFVEQHLDGCEACAVFVDGYARFLVHLDGKPPRDSKLDAAVARLDARMRPYLDSVLDGESLATQLLRQAFGVAEVVHIATQRLQDLAQAHPGWALTRWRSAEPALAWASSSDTLDAVQIDDVIVQKPDGCTTVTTAQLVYPPRWPSERVDLLLELDLGFRGFDASVSYLLDPTPDGPPATALVLFQGPVDQEGLVEIQSPWDGPCPALFDAARLKLCLCAPSLPAS